jgi:hypothetical protein
MWDANPVLDGGIFLLSITGAAILLWEAATLMLSHLGANLWRLTLTELVMRNPIIGLGVVLTFVFTIGWLSGHWVDAVRSARAV